MSASTHHYVIALGSNRRGRHGSPRQELAAAVAAIGGVVAQSRVIETAPLGPSRRRFANAAILIESAETPAELLARLKQTVIDNGNVFEVLMDAVRVCSLGGRVPSRGCTEPRAKTRGSYY